MGRGRDRAGAASARCRATLSVDVQELFESAPREGESYALGHDRVDLEPLARESLILDLPLAPLCRDDCRGLCPTCGADLNQGACDCPVETVDPRWAALDVLRSVGDE